MTTDELKALRAETTPGPWDAAIERGCHGVIARTLPEGGANFVALVGNDTDTPEKEQIRFANARLIAKSPDLGAEVITLREQNAELTAEVTAIREQNARMVEALRFYAGSIRVAAVNDGGWRAAEVLAEIEKEANGAP